MFPLHAGPAVGLWMDGCLGGETDKQCFGCSSTERRVTGNVVLERAWDLGRVDLVDEARQSVPDVRECVRRLVWWRRLRRSCEVGSPCSLEIGEEVKSFIGSLARLIG